MFVRQGIRVLKTLTTRSRNFSAFSGEPKEWIVPYPTSKDNHNTYDLSIPIPPPLKRENESIENKRARLVYNSRKRGILETDLLLGTYAKIALKNMSLSQLEEYDSLLDENDWDIYYWSTGAKHVPKHIQMLSFWPELVEHCKNKSKVVLKMPTLD
ncbi:Flavinator of succinate dehydrogenase-domain-containing protein [Globomyces pollinis-pini]|nr:Flavinator of succinate dehydrogenase-domain-containing protein [Globomyces pollinis-pini]